MADPGGICVSRVVRDQVRDRLDYTFADMASSRSKTLLGQYGSMRCTAKIMLDYRRGP
jgi:hypothetical protein